MKQKVLLFASCIALYLAAANCIATGIALNELYSDIVEYVDKRREIKKAEKELHRKAKEAKQTA